MFREKLAPMQPAFVFALLAVASLLLSACATNPVTGKRDFVMLSEDQEIELGRSEHQKVMQHFKEYKDPELQAYVDRIGQELAEKSHRDNLVFRFTLLDDPMVNAFALPGGYIYITRGIMSYMNSEADLAGVLGHEIGHVTARHSVRQHAQQQLAGIAGVVATVATGSRGVADLSNVLGTALVRGYGRKHELEADGLGAEYIARVGYDPDEMIDVIGILKDQQDFSTQKAKAEGRQPPSYHGTFSTHPRNDDRLKEVIGAAKSIQAPVTRDENRDEFLEKISGMTFGHSEKEGVFRNNRFYHGPLDFTVTFPQGWRTENQPDRLIAVSPDRNSILQIRLRDQNRREPPHKFLSRQFKSFKAGRDFNTEDFEAHAGVAPLQTPFGRKPSRVAAIYHGNRIFVVAAANKNGLIGDSFFDTAESLRRLRSQERELAKARHIKLIRARSGDTFARLARNSPLTNYAEDHLRVINGMYPDGEPTPGQMIKIVQ